jgi:glyoxylase-like metal-dependent hydrolase (beta-lactamase superfamily II)
MITKDIYQVGGSDFTAPEDAAAYLIHMDGRAAIVDAGCGNATDRLLENIRSCNVPDEAIDYLLITHCHFDHTGGAAELKERLNLKVVAHSLDAEYLEKGDQHVTAASWYGAVLKPVSVDIKLNKPEETIHLGSREISAIHVPGHSPGSVVYQVISDGKKVLFAQDVHGPIHPDLLSDPVAYQVSLKKMLDLNVDILCEGHYGIYHGKDAVRDFISSFMKS